MNGALEASINKYTIKKGIPDIKTFLIKIPFCENLIKKSITKNTYKNLTWFSDHLFYFKQILSCKNTKKYPTFFHLIW